MQSQRVLVTKCPTIEKIDASVISATIPAERWICTCKSGKKEKVTLVSGRVSLSPPVGVEFIQVTSAADMYKAVTEIAKEQDIIIKAAAVSDFTPSDTYEHKLKKDKMPELKLTKNPDILMELGKEKNYFLVGFCMETENLIQNAIEKLNKKNLDMIVANSLNEKGAGFGTDTNIATIITPQKQESLPLMSKYELAIRF